MAYLPGASPDRPPSYIARLLASARAEDEIDRQVEWRERWLAYMGRKEPVLEVEEGDPDDNVLVPYEQMVVNKGRSFLFGKGDIRFTIEQESVDTPSPPSTPAADPANGSAPIPNTPGPLAAANPQAASGSSTMQKWLDETWKRNWKKTLLLKYATNGGIFGHGFLKIIHEAPYPRLVNLDPATVTAHYDDQDIERVNAYEIVYNTVDDDGVEIIHKELIEREELDEEVQVEKNVTETTSRDTSATRPPGAPEPPEAAINLAPIPQPSVQWTITHLEADHDDDDWVTVEGPDVWPYEWPPVIDNQNLPVPNEYLGMSDIELAQMNLARAIDRLLSNLGRIVRLHAHPFLFTTGLTDQEVMQMQLALDPDSITNLPAPDAKLQALEMQSDLGSSITLFMKLKELWHEVTRIPEVSTGKTENVGPLSGVALEILYGPLAEATDDKHCTYGDMLIELNRRLLDLGGYGYENWVNIEWPETIPKDAQSEGAILMQDKQLGASEETLLAKRGYDPKREKELRKQEAEENMAMNAQSMGMQQAVAGETPQESQQAAQKEQREDVSRGSQPGSGQFGRNANR
ncbi:MAG: phage portal protein [Rubrobacteraceae bacterium]